MIKQRHPCVLLKSCPCTFIGKIYIYVCHIQGHIFKGLLGCVIENWTGQASVFSLNVWFSCTRPSHAKNCTVHEIVDMHVPVIYSCTPHVSFIRRTWEQIRNSSGPIGPVSTSCTTFTGSIPLVPSPILEKPFFFASAQLCIIESLLSFHAFVY